MNELLTFKETMELLKISRPTLNRWVRDGKINMLKLGEGRRGTVRFRKKDIEEFLKRSGNNG